MQKELTFSFTDFIVMFNFKEFYFFKNYMQINNVRLTVWSQLQLTIKYNKCVLLDNKVMVLLWFHLLSMFSKQTIMQAIN
jgi:hypothetical protein